jgi:hypothetical protein
MKMTYAIIELISYAAERHWNITNGWDWFEDESLKDKLVIQYYGLEEQDLKFLRWYNLEHFYDTESEELLVVID